MLSKRAHSLSVFIFCSTVAGQGAAQQFSFLDDSVLSRLSADEMASLRTTINAGLDSSPDAELILWNSPTSDRSGRIMPKFSYATNGTVCRRTLFQFEESGRAGQIYRFDLCQQQQQWLIANSPATFRGKERDELEIFLSSALEKQQTGLPLTWRGMESGHSAVIVPLVNEAELAENCRTAALTLIDREGQVLSGRYRFCLNSTEEWEYSPL